MRRVHVKRTRSLHLDGCKRIEHLSRKKVGGKGRIWVLTECFKRGRQVGFPKPTEICHCKDGLWLRCHA